MKRIRIGNLFGTKGIFVSKPGHDVTVPGTQLTMDTRYDYLQIHTKGSFNLASLETDEANGWIYEDRDTFPSLGYAPLFYATIRFRDGYLGTNVCWYPFVSGSQNDYPADTFGGDDQLRFTGVRIENNDTVHAQAAFAWDVGGSDRPLLACDYVIFKNRAA